MIYNHTPMLTWLATLGAVILISLISLIGIFTLLLKKETVSRLTFVLVSFAVGGLFGDAFLHLIPEAYRELGLGPKTAFLILGGVFIFFVLEKLLRWRHCHIQPSREHVHPLATMNIFGDAVHNFIDGMIIAASFLSSVSLGITTTLAVVLHEIPQEMGDFGILLHSKLPARKALFLNFLTALTAIAGAIVVLILGKQIVGFSNYIVPLTAGGFIYIAGSDLIPELHHDCGTSLSFWQLLWIVFGIGIMALLLFLG